MDRAGDVADDYNIPSSSERSYDLETTSDKSASLDGSSSGKSFADSVEASANDNGSRRNRRKQLCPQRSVLPYDPSFRGVHIFMRVVVENMESRLEMNHYFQLDSSKRRYRRYRNLRNRNQYAGLDKVKNNMDADEDDEELQPSNVPYEKHCASCSVKKTPLWRDAEDGTPLCNACGIRYKKYKIRCARCWHIPKKDEFSPNCISCGSGFQFAPSKHW